MMEFETWSSEKKLLALLTAVFGLMMAAFFFNPTPSVNPQTTGFSKSQFVHYLANESDPHAFTRPYSVYELCNPSPLNNLTILDSKGFNVSFKEAGTKSKLVSSSVEFWNRSESLQEVNRSYWKENGTEKLENGTIVPHFDFVENVTKELVSTAQWVPFVPTGFEIPKGECVKLKVSGVKKAGLGSSNVDNVLGFAGFTFPEFAWWNSTFLERTNFTLNFTYSVNATPVLVNITGLSVPSQNCSIDLRLTNGTDFEIRSLAIVSNGTAGSSDQGIGKRWCQIAFLANGTQNLNQTFWVYDNNTYVVPPTGYATLFFAETFDNYTIGATITGDNGWVAQGSATGNLSASATSFVTNYDGTSTGRLSANNTLPIKNIAIQPYHTFFQSVTVPGFHLRFFMNPQTGSDYQSSYTWEVFNTAQTRGMVMGNDQNTNLTHVCQAGACWTVSVMTKKLQLGTWYEVYYNESQALVNGKYNIEVWNSTDYGNKNNMCGISVCTFTTLDRIRLSNGAGSGALANPPYVFLTDDIWAWNENFSLANFTPRFDLGVRQSDVINVTLQAPVNDTLVTNTTQNFTFSFNYSNNLTNVNNCSLYLNSSAGLMIFNKSNESGIVWGWNNITLNTSQVVNVVSQYLWNVNCTDAAGSSNFAYDDNHTAVLEYVPVATTPKFSFGVNLTTENNTASNDSTSVVLSYNYSGNQSNINNCSVYLNNTEGKGLAFNTSNATNIVGGVNNITVNLGGPLGKQLLWNVNCSNSTDYAMSSFNKTIRTSNNTVQGGVSRTISGSNVTCNFTTQQNQLVQPFGQTPTTGYFNFTNKGSWISNLSVYVLNLTNSSYQLFLNTSQNATLANLTRFGNATVFHDWAIGEANAAYVWLWVNCSSELRSFFPRLRFTLVAS